MGIDTKKLEIAAASAAGNLYLQQERIESENDRAAANTVAKLATDAVSANTKAQVEGGRLSIEAARILQQRNVSPGGN
jgi:hypothetical protein